MKPIQTQLQLWWSLTFNAETASIYKVALTRTGLIIVEFARLVWLVLCLVLVAIAELSKLAQVLGRNSRQLLATRKSQPANAVFSNMGKSLVLVSSQTSGKVLANARQQLGIEPLQLERKLELVPVQESESDAELQATQTQTLQGPRESEPSPQSSAVAAPTLDKQAKS